MIFDSHAHYDDTRYNDDRADILKLLPELGVGMVMNVGTSRESCKTSVELAASYDYIYAAVGIHPHEAENALPQDLDLIAEFANEPKVRAIGEIGLDYHYDFSPHDVQKLWFDKLLGLASELNMPVIIHDREAHADCLEIIRRYKLRGVFHCYSGSLEMAKELVSMGFYIGITGVVTFSNAKKLVEIAKWLPDDRLLIETDCPYLTPTPHRNTRNHSGHLKYVVQTLADIRNSTTEDIKALTENNAKALFGLDI